MEYYIKEIWQLISTNGHKVIGAMHKYVVHMLMENLFTKFHFIKVHKYHVLMLL